MTKESRLELKNLIANQFYKFVNMVYGCEGELDEDMERAIKKMCALVNAAEKNEIDDFDLLVFLSYRQGKKLSKKSKIIREEPKPLVQAMAEGFEVPDDATLVVLEVKAVLKNNYDVRVIPESFYTIKFGLNNGEKLTEAQLKRRYGLTYDDNLFSVEDLSKNGKILKFYKRNKYLGN